MLMDEIPLELVINLDQTAPHYVPVSPWSMEMEGAKRVKVVGKMTSVRSLQFLGINEWQFSVNSTCVSRKDNQVFANI